MRRALDPAAAARARDYLVLLEKWNRVYNLTAIRDSSQWVSHHLLDCLAVVPHLPAGALVDVGSGAGLPGIPIALANPMRPVTLLESNQKKCAFLRQVVGQLGLANVTTVPSRVEAYRPTALFDGVISRAFSDLPEFLASAGHLCAPGGRLLAMKGVYPDEELSQLPAGVVERVLRLEVPGLRAERHLVTIDPLRRLGN